MSRLAVLVLALLAAAPAQSQAPPDSAGASPLAVAERPATPEGRMVWWCLADEYRRVAARAQDETVSGAARRAAVQSERAGPSPAEVGAMGLVPGQTVTVEVSPGRTCQTTVRRARSD